MASRVVYDDIEDLKVRIDDLNEERRELLARDTWGTATSEDEEELTRLEQLVRDMLLELSELEEQWDGDI